MQFTLRLKCRVLLPPPNPRCPLDIASSPLRGRRGSAKRTSVISQSYKAYLRYVFRVEGNSAPPPLLKGGEGVRGREGTFGL